MCVRPSPEMRSPAARQSDRAKSQKSIKSTSTLAGELTDRQALKIARRYFLAHTMARTIAALAFGGSR
jgi:hypothetical protein